MAVIDLQGRKMWRDILHSPIVSAFLFVAVILLIGSNYNIYKINQTAKMNRDEADRKLALLQAKDNRLAAALQSLKTTRGVEEELRSKFEVTKPGEEVLVVVDDPASSSSVGTISAGGDSYWQQIKSFFGF